MSRRSAAIDDACGTAPRLDPQGHESILVAATNMTGGIEIADQ